MAHILGLSDRHLPSSRTSANSSRDRSPLPLNSHSALDSWRQYREQFRSQPQHNASVLDYYQNSLKVQSPSHRNRSPVLKLRGDLDGFYKKATNSRPTSPRSLLSNATFEPLILRTKAETKVAQELTEPQPPLITKLPQVLTHGDVSKAIEMLESSREVDCEKLPRQYVEDLIRLAKAVNEKLGK